MRFGLFGSAAARRPSSADAAEFDSAEGFRDFIDYNVEAEGLGFHGTFVVEHHFTGYGQVSATLNLLTWLGARTTTLRLGTAVIVLPWHNPVLLAEQAATLDLLSGGRLDFGIGKGYRYNEFAGFCVDDGGGRRALRRMPRRHRQGLDLERAVLASRQILGSSTMSSSSRRPRSARTRRSGWAPAAKVSVRRVAEKRLQPAARANTPQPADVAKSIAAYRAGGRGAGPALRPDVGRRHPRLLRLRQGGGQGGGARAPARQPGAPAEARDAARRHRPWRPRPRHRRPRYDQPRQRDVRHARTRSPQKLDELRDAGVGYVLVNGGGSGGGERGRHQHAPLRRAR